MLDGFRSVLPDGGDIVISQEAATYRPEMEWIAARLNQTSERSNINIRLARGPCRKIRSARWTRCLSVLRIVRPAKHSGNRKHDAREAEGRITITPPIKPYLEEKMWFALFWMQPLREFWRRELGEKYFIKLQEVIPYSWLLDPTPLPQHAVIPRLEIHDWREAAKFSQKDRDLTPESKRVFAAWLGQPRHHARARSAHAEWESESNTLSQHSNHPRRSCSVFTKAGCLSTAIGIQIQAS